jgi:hypothetical protein
METREKLDKLAECQAQKTLLDMDKQKMIDSVLTPEIKAKIDDINTEFSDKSSGVTKNIDDLTAEIKGEILTLGETVKGQYLSAVFAKGRVSWDTKALDGYLIDHPELNKYRKEGEPSVSIRKV